MSALDDLRSAVEQAAGAVATRAGAGPAGGEGRQAPSLQRPPRPDFGDYSTNIALLLAASIGRPAREVAEEVGNELRERLGAGLDRVEVAGPGFLNVFLSDPWFVRALGTILQANGRYGAGVAADPERIDIEFVSANPTGPLTVAHGRHAAYGDSLARILEFAGHSVSREFYVNDYGSQVARLGESIRARARGEQVPEDGYQGDYVAELVNPARAADLSADELARLGVAACLELIGATLERFRVRFDTWFSEASLHDGDQVAAALAALETAGAVYRSEGALWLRTSSLGDDKDRVLERSSGEHTYFASDIAYHQDKIARGFDRLIDVWGADHHGYVARVRAAFEALGGRPGALEIVIMQFVHLIERGKRSSMSKRRGEFVSLDDLIEEIGVDAARYFLLARSHDSTVEVDLALARERSAENPVYYIQYAHARIASMLDKAGGASVEATPHALGEDLPALQSAERALIKKLISFPVELADAADRRAPHRIAAFALELAQEFTAFYRDCRVVGAQPQALESWRIALSGAAQVTIARCLELLGVSAPDSM